MVWRWLDRTEIDDWLGNTWDFSKQIVPLLFGGVFVVGSLIWLRRAPVALQ